MAVAAALGWGGGAPGEARTCEFSAEFTLAPGLSLQPGSGTFTSEGETGRMTCGGVAGAFGADGRYGTRDPDTCTGGEGDGVQSFWAPAPDRPAHVTNPIRFVYGAVSEDGVMAGRFEGDRFSGTFRIVPLAGDCVTAPVTRVLLRGRGVLHESGG